MTLSSGVARHFVPHVARQHLPRNHAPLVQQEIVEQFVFARGEFHVPAAARHPARDPIRLKIGDDKAQHVLDTTAPQERPDTREKFLEGEGFDQIVVGPLVETTDAVLHRVPRREDDYRRRQSSLTHGTQDLQAVSARQHEVENKQVEHLGRDEKETILPGARHGHIEALGLQPVLQGLGDFELVFDDQDTHDKVVETKANNL
jgi:hypothetical protein